MKNYKTRRSGAISVATTAVFCLEDEASVASEKTRKVACTHWFMER